MKSPFSAWFGLYVMIGACVALFGYTTFVRDSGVVRFRATDVEKKTSGIVRSIHEDGSDATSTSRAVVLLADGTEVDGAIAPGCLLFVGDHVVVHAMQPLRSMQKTYLVMPESVPRGD